MFNKIILALTFLLFVIPSCKNEKIENVKLKTDVQIIAKYLVHDFRASRNIVNCANEIKPFLEMDKYDCSFLLEDSTMDIEYKYVFDSLGKLNEYWPYLSEGPLIYKKKELESDKKFLEYIGCENIQVKVSKKLNAIIENGKKIKIERIFENEKLIFVERTKNQIKNGRRTIYEFK